MGTGIRIFVEYDFSQTYKDLSPEEVEPFNANHSVWDLKHDALDWVKDYNFFAALAGVRNNENDIKPLFPPRGLPPNCQWFVKQELSGESPPLSWLLAHELVAALEHAKLSNDDLSVPAQLVVETVALLAARCGFDRVRIVFGFT